MAGKQLVVRPMLDGYPGAHTWSIGASEGAHGVRLDTLDEGQTRLLACVPAQAGDAGACTTANPLQHHAHTVDYLPSTHSNLPGPQQACFWFPCFVRTS